MSGEPIPAASRLPPIVAGLLVGGASRRMGRAKARVELGGRALAERVAAALAAVTTEIVLLGDGEVPESLAGWPRLADRAGVGGPLGAALAALAARPGRAWLLAACDQGLATPAACLWLVEQRAAGRVAILPRRSPAGVEPMLALYEPSARPLLEQISAAGGRSLQALAARPGVATPAPPPELAEAWTSIDDERKLAELERRLAGVKGETREA